MADLCVVKNIELTVELSIKQACDDPACDVFKTEWILIFCLDFFQDPNSRHFDACIRNPTENSEAFQQIHPEELI